MSELAEQLAREFSDKEYAHAYMEEHANMALAAQIKTLRENLDMTQTELAELAKMKQERISALENVEYNAWTVKTLRKLAKAFDVHLKVSFVPFSKGILDVVNLSREQLSIPAREDDLAKFRNCYLVHRDRTWKVLDASHLAAVTNLPSSAPVEPRSTWQRFNMVVNG